MDKLSSYLIGLVGKSGHGKDYTAKIIQSVFEQAGQPYQITSWALSLRELLYQLLGLPISLTLSEQGKASHIYLTDDSIEAIPNIPIVWVVALPTLSSLTTGIANFLYSRNIAVSSDKLDKAGQYLYSYLDNNRTPTIRQLLQTVGTEVMRNHISIDIWVDLLISKWQMEGCPTTVITDCRFVNEYQAVKTHGRILRVVRVDCYGQIYINPGIDPIHSSETSLDHLVGEMDTVVNDMTNRYNQLVVQWVKNLIS